MNKQYRIDEILAQDDNGRVACEVLIITNLIVVTDEITTVAELNVKSLYAMNLKISDI